MELIFLAKKPSKCVLKMEMMIATKSGYYVLLDGSKLKKTQQIVPYTQIKKSISLLKTTDIYAYILSIL